MVFLAAIGGESLCRVYLLCDAHVVSASSDGIRQPCTGTLGDAVLEANFFNKSAFLRGKLCYLHSRTQWVVQHNFQMQII